MTLRSAYQDFVLHTLAALAGSLQKLNYLGSLADDNCGYSHWGMSRTFGPRQASEALAQAHTETWLDVLRTPIPSLFGEYQELEAGDGREIGRERYPADERKLSPMNPGGGSRRHFNSVLLALSLLSQAAKEPSQKAA